MEKRALFSLYNLDKVERFARRLYQLGWKIIASRETYDILSKKGIPVIDIAQFTGIKEAYPFPPTLHPKIESYITAPKGPHIDLVYVIPYPLSVGNDVGGRTLLALAVKGNRIPVMSVSDMELVIKELENRGRISKKLHQHLKDKTNALIASHYDDLIKERRSYDIILGGFQYNLLNGENPYQIPADLFSVKRNDALSIHNFKQLSVNPTCFTNLADADSIIQTMCLASEAFNLRYKKTPFICIAAKHGNACGMAISWDKPSLAIRKALFGNPKAIWGGELVVNFSIDESLAGLLYKSKQRQRLFGQAAWMLDVIVAAHFTSGAIRVLGQRQKRKLLENKALLSPFLSSFKYTYRFVRGGFLRQPPHNFVLDLKRTKIVRHIDKQLLDSLIIAWAVAWSSNHGGNEIAIAKDSQLLAVGGGPSTIEAALTAVRRAKDCGHNLKGSVFAANAFFPFTDAPGELIKAGCILGVVPGGGKNIKSVKGLFKKHKVNVSYLPEQFRGFSRH